MVTPAVLVLLIFHVNVIGDPVIAVELDSNGWCVDTRCYFSIDF